MTETEILKFVITSGILEEYELNSACLRKLTSMASQNPEIWRSHINIDVFPSHAGASHIRRIYRVRLRILSKDSSKQQLRESTKKLVDYCDAYPQSKIAGAKFKCATESFLVFIGVTDDHTQAICVIKGGASPLFVKIR